MAKRSGVGWLWLWLSPLLFAMGCMRGCMCTGRAKPCSSNADCDSETKCLRAYCRENALVEKDTACRAAEACAELGVCGAEYRSSFLGVSDEIECVAVDEKDCRASNVCAHDARCSLVGSECNIGSESDCTKSSRCETHDECVYVDGRCARTWEPCAANDAMTKMPSWGKPAAIYKVDLGKIEPVPAAAEPFEGSIACTAGENRDFDWFSVRVGGACKLDVAINEDVHSVSFVVPGVTLRKSDSVAVAFVDHEFIGADAPAFVKAKYEGASPFGGKLDAAFIECRLVSKEAALSMAKSSFEATDAALASSAGDKADPTQYTSAPRGIRDIEESLSIAAAFVGWNHAEVEKRVAARENALAQWAANMANSFDQLAAKATPVNKPAALEHLTVRATRVVCGADVATRAKPLEIYRAHKEVDCGIELVVRNTRRDPLDFDTGTGRMDPFFTADFIRRTPAGVAVMSAMAVDVRPDVAGAAPVSTLKLGPGASAVLLVIGRDDPLSLGHGKADERALLRLRMLGGEGANLRTDAPE